MTGITHPEGCMCEGCVRARAERGDSCAPGASACQGSGVRPGRGGSSCPSVGGPCFCTGACRGESQETATFGIIGVSKPRTFMDEVDSVRAWNRDHSAGQWAADR